MKAACSRSLNKKLGVTLGMALLFMFVGMSVSLGKNMILLGGKSVTVVNC